MNLKRVLGNDCRSWGVHAVFASKSSATTAQHPYDALENQEVALVLDIAEKRGPGSVGGQTRALGAIEGLRAKQLRSTEIREVMRLHQ